ncbi:pilin [Patescibacteria group bacterium]|nr:pilin [Patescibacteria group bacterium]
MKRLKELTSYLMFAPVLLANDVIKIEPGEGFTGLENITVPAIISTAVKLLLVIAALISFIFLVLGGIRWITSGGDKDGTAKAQGTITAALIGLVIVFAAWAIIRLLQTFFGIGPIFEFKIPVIQ